MLSPTRVFIADDHPIFRVGLRNSIEDLSGYRVVGEAGDGETALAKIRELSPNIAVLDIEMPKLDGFGVARRVSELQLTTKIIFLTLHKEEEFFRAALGVGAHAYLLKDNAVREIITGLEAVSDGRLYVSPGVITKRDTRPKVVDCSVPESFTANLTATERHILKLIGEGKSSKEIGMVLPLHHRTIENYRTNICRKLGIQGANALLRFALEHKSVL